MSLASFHELLTLIQDHLIFHNNSNASQRPVRDHLMVTLQQMGMFALQKGLYWLQPPAVTSARGDRGYIGRPDRFYTNVTSVAATDLAAGGCNRYNPFGGVGNGALVGILARFFRMLEGAVILYCSRVVEAILSLESTYVYWPDTDTRKKIASDISNTTGFNGCVGFIDGTLLPLNKKPSIDSQDYYSCKGSYGLATLVVCDKHKRIIYYLTGWPGCSHDTQLWENCDLNLHKEQFFLTELTLVKTMEKLTKWVGACMVLHNFLLADATPDIDHDSIDVTASLDNNDLPRQGVNSAGNQLQEKVYKEVLQYLRLS
ncbi:hypothetical protein PCASD_11776 [Puccinia coronata f. sp. avenae]|uniref:DDE Tnp4 domain-containing protein n=1 Tax=Puccinia coronata f. sp. avenae TaxID=200324 RepID=A0A2N5UK54_9BASI|nr:hypothetical protein PCASD_11776 [Puccinia coronata f. sp. avenae]